MGELEYIEARKNEGRYKRGDGSRAQAICSQCRKGYYDYIGELRDAAAGLMALVCPYCRQVARRYQDWAR